jgi:porphobilinogen synthase
VIQRALRELRPRFPSSCCSPTSASASTPSHGHCGVIVGRQVDNDATLELLARTAVSHVDAGADAVCPSDMMDGRVRGDPRGAAETPIVAYSPSTPRRSTARSARRPTRRRRSATAAATRWIPANVREALRECELDVAEGADVMMVKPALPYLDVIRARARRFDVPLAAYNVSGEYAMVKAPPLAAGSTSDGRAGVADAIKRAGADIVVFVLDEGPRVVALSTRSDLYRRALELIPGGVNSPVRAMRAVGWTSRCSWPVRRAPRSRMSRAVATSTG